jgi:hypothetical protein
MGQECQLDLQKRQYLAPQELQVGLQPGAPNLIDLIFGHRDLVAQQLPATGSAWF